MHGGLALPLLLIGGEYEVELYNWHVKDAPQDSGDMF